MSRREIRRMLLGQQTETSVPRWAIPAALGAVLLIGVGIGVGVGIGMMPGHPDSTGQVEWEKAEMAVDRPTAPENLPAPVEEEANSEEPVAPPPAPRPGGENDSGGLSTPEPASPAAEDTPPPPAAIAMAPAPVPPRSAGTPAWVKYAVPAPKTNGRPMIAVVIDDLGVDRKRSEKVLPLRAPLTLAWMTYAHDLPRLTREAHGRGHELLVHVPMQPMGANFNPGPDVLDTSVAAEENRRRLIWGLERFEGFVGINNHMGSRFTSDRAGMRVVMEELKKRGLLFLDSVTTDKSVAPELAHSHGVPFAARNVFIDNEQSVAAVTAQLQKAEAYARRYGAAIAIGHPHDATIEALSHWLPSLDAKGLTLVPVTTIVRSRGTSNGG